MNKSSKIFKGLLVIICIIIAKIIITVERVWLKELLDLFAFSSNVKIRMFIECIVAAGSYFLILVAVASVLTKVYKN